MIAICDGGRVKDIKLKNIFNFYVLKTGVVYKQTKIRQQERVDSINFQK